jgi:hypothetical protein
MSFVSLLADFLAHLIHRPSVELQLSSPGSKSLRPAPPHPGYLENDVAVVLSMRQKHGHEILNQPTIRLVNSFSPKGRTPI